MNILAIETSSEYCSVALLMNEDLFDKELHIPQGHTRALLPMCEQVLSEAGISLRQLHGIAYAQGPGAFTGVRIAVSAAQGIALGAALPVIPVSSLAALALGAVQGYHTSPMTVATALDARMSEVYWGTFIADAQRFTAIPLIAECVCAAAEVPLPLPIQPILGAGPGWKVYETPLRNRFQNYDLAVYDELLPKASQIARLAVHEKAIDPADAVPVYLRDRVVQTSANYVKK